MVSPHVYVPILKYKDAEVFSLVSLSDDQKKQIVPLFQLVHQYWYETAEDKDGNDIRIRHEYSREAVLQRVLANIKRKLSDMRLFLDVSIMYPTNREQAWKEIVEYPTTLFGNNIVIVLNCEDLTAYTPVGSVKEYFLNKGIALRVYKNQLTDDFWDDVDKSLARIGLSRSSVDLVLDYQIPDADTPSHIKKQLDPGRTNGWRSITVASGSFREDLTGLSPGNHDFPRTDWLLWLSLFSGNGISIPPNLGYGDYTIQYPIYSQSPEQIRGSRSVRYAKEEKWVVVKGLTDDAKNSAKTKQYYAHAQVLVNSGIACDEDCCWGDKFIFAIKNKTTTKYGGLSTWLRVGINHHISLTIKQLVSLGQTAD